MMQVVFIEGCMNDRVRGVLREAFGTDAVPMVGYDGGWWSQMAYVGADEKLDELDYRRIRMDAFQVLSRYGKSLPDAYEAPGCVIWYLYSKDRFIHLKKEPSINIWGQPFEVLVWCIDGADTGIEDVYEG